MPIERDAHRIALVVQRLRARLRSASAQTRAGISHKGNATGVVLSYYLCILLNRQYTWYNCNVQQ
jgi:hypothetical protein